MRLDSTRLAAFAGVLFAFITLMGVSAVPIHGSRLRLVRRHSKELIASITKRDEQVCNGHAELCDRPYGNVTFLGSHDSFAHSSSPFALSRTQEVNVTEQLKLGVRMLQAQGHMNGDKLHFCHTSCVLYDGGSVEDYLRNVKQFLDENPNEVITLLFTNPELHSVQTAWKPAFENSGIANISYIPPQAIMSRDDWPTLGQMISSGKRVVVFLDKGADQRANPEDEYILPEFKMMWEDAYDPTDASFPCKVDRTAGPLNPTQQLNLMNHNLNVDIFPIGRGIRFTDRLNSPRTNSVNSIYSHAQNCAAIMEDKAPNFVLLDYVNIGYGLAAVDQLNGFTKSLTDFMRQIAIAHI